MIETNWFPEIGYVGIAIVLDSLLVALLFHHYRTPRFIFPWALLSRVLTYPLFYVFIFLNIYVMRSPYVPFFLRHLFIGLPSLFLPAALGVLLSGFFLHYLCQHLSPPTNQSPLPTLQRCWAVSCAGTCCGFLTSILLTVLTGYIAHRQ